MNNYYGLEVDYKITTPDNVVHFLNLDNLLNTSFNKYKKEELKVQQYTGVKDRKKQKIYFGDTLRFVDKWEWYRGEWGWKLYGKTGEELKRLQKEYRELPFEERVITNIEDYEWLLSSEIQEYWELI